MIALLLLSASLFGTCSTPGRIGCAVHEEVLDRAEPVAVAPIPAPDAGESPARNVFRARAAAVVAVMAPDGQGSGSILRPDGWILTCAHVVGDATHVGIGLQDGRNFDGKVVAVDANADLALIKIESPAALPILAIGDLDHVELGSTVIAIGHPKGFAWTVNDGIVTNLFAFRDGKRDPGVIQTQVPLNPGNSGGPLLDKEGRLVGVVTQGDPTAQALNWCISARTVKRFLASNATQLPMATLNVRVATPGAAVEVDSHPIGVAPLAHVELAPGAHVIRVSKDGMGEVLTPVVILQRDTATIDVHLAPAGSLAVTADTDAVQVYVDGIFRGMAPVTLDIAEGAHEILGAKAGTRDSHASTQVKAARETEISLSHPQNVAFLSVQSSPDGADVTIDGEEVGTTPVADQTVEPGRHIVDVRRGSHARRIVVEVAADGRRKLDFDLAPDDEDVPAPTAAAASVATRAARGGGFTPRSDMRFARELMVGSLALVGVSAAVMLTQHDPMARDAAAATMLAGGTGFVIGPMWIRQRGAGGRGGDSGGSPVLGARAGFAF